MQGGRRHEAKEEGLREGVQRRDQVPAAGDQRAPQSPGKG